MQSCLGVVTLINQRTTLITFRPPKACALLQLAEPSSLSAKRLLYATVRAVVLNAHCRTQMHFLATISSLCVPDAATRHLPAMPEQLPKPTSSDFKQF